MTAHEPSSLADPGHTEPEPSALGWLPQKLGLQRFASWAVSYTHLTLPTTSRV